MRRPLAASILVPICCFALLVVGCGASTTTSLQVGQLDVGANEAKPLMLQRAVFISGETMKFELSLRGLVGGEAVTAVGAPGNVDGRSVVIVKSRVESAGLAAVIKEVRDEVETWVAMDSGRPVRHYSDSTFGAKQATIETDFGQGKGGSFALQYQRKGSNKITLYQRVPDGVAVYDVHGALGALRAWESNEGEMASLYVMAGRRIWRNAVRMTGRETIRTPFGRFPARRIDGVAYRQRRGLTDDKSKAPRQFSIWLSDDSNRIPILVMAKTEYGDVRVEMTNYSRPDQRISWR